MASTSPDASSDRPRKRLKKGTPEFQAYCAYLSVTPWHKLFTPAIIANFPGLCKHKDVNCAGNSRDPDQTARFIYHFAVDLYNHVQRTPFWRNKCGDRSDDLAWFIHRVTLDGPAIPAWSIQKDPARRSPRAEAWTDELRASIPTTRPYPSVRLAPLHEFEDTWYCAITLLQDLYEDVRLRMNSGFVRWAEVVHDHGTMGATPGTPCRVYDLLEFCWMMWFYNNESDFVCTLNRAVRARNERELGLRSGLIDVNAQPMSLTFDMLYRKHRLDRYAVKGRTEEEEGRRARVDWEEEQWIRRVYGLGTGSRVPGHGGSPSRSLSEKGAAPRSTTAPDLLRAGSPGIWSPRLHRRATTTELGPKSRAKESVDARLMQSRFTNSPLFDPIQLDITSNTSGTRTTTTLIPPRSSTGSPTRNPSSRNSTRNPSPHKPRLDLNKPLPSIPPQHESPLPPYHPSPASPPRDKPSRIRKSATKALQLPRHALRILTGSSRPSAACDAHEGAHASADATPGSASTGSASTPRTVTGSEPGSATTAPTPTSGGAMEPWQVYLRSPERVRGVGGVGLALSPVQEVMWEEGEGKEGEGKEGEMESDEKRRAREMRPDYVLPRTVYAPEEGE